MTATSTTRRRITQKERNRIERERLAAKREAERAADPYALPKRFGWPNYIVPTWQLRAFIEKNKRQWQAQFVPTQTTTKNVSYTLNTAEDDGWKTALTMSAAQILRKGEAAVVRRLYDVMTDRSTVIHAEFADAVCLSVGLHLERDAKLTVLPGSKKLAEEMIRERTAFLKHNPSREEILTASRCLLWITSQIVYHPERHDDMVARAPFDVLRAA